MSRRRGVCGQRGNSRPTAFRRRLGVWMLCGAMLAQPLGGCAAEVAEDPVVVEDKAVNPLSVLVVAILIMYILYLRNHHPELWPSLNVLGATERIASGARGGVMAGVRPLTDRDYSDLLVITGDAAEWWSDHHGKWADWRAFVRQPWVAWSWSRDLASAHKSALVVAAFYHSKRGNVMDVAKRAFCHYVGRVPAALQEVASVGCNRVFELIAHSN